MTRETDAVVFTRRETWRKALAVLSKRLAAYRGCEEDGELAAVLRIMTDAAAYDGVTFDEPSR